MRRLFIASSLALSLFPGLALADQLQCNDKSVAESALKMLRPGSVFIDFCSLCEAKVQVVRITSARAIKDCDYEVEVKGEVVSETANAFANGYVPGKAKFGRPSKQAYTGRLDLAYAYVEVKENDFRWLGGQLGLQASVNTASIQLPPQVYAKLGKHATVQSSGPVEVAAPAPSNAEIQRVFEYFRRGDKGVVLGHLVPCLKVDLRKGSATRYECTEVLKGSVKPGTQVFAWTDWLVPRGVKGAAEIQILKDGEVKLARRVVLKGRAATPIVPGTAGAKLSQLGIYTFRVVLDGKTEAEVSVEVRN
jgi:hypothetical protein